MTSNVLHLVGTAIWYVIDDYCLHDNRELSRSAEVAFLSAILVIASLGTLIIIDVQN